MLVLTRHKRGINCPNELGETLLLFGLEMNLIGLKISGKIYHKHGKPAQAVNENKNDQSQLEKGHKQPTERPQSFYRRNIVNKRMNTTSLTEQSSTFPRRKTINIHPTGKRTYSIQKNEIKQTINQQQTNSGLTTLFWQINLYDPYVSTHSIIPMPSMFPRIAVQGLLQFFFNNSR